MLKKILIAVGVIVLLMVVAVAGLSYYVYSKVAPTISQFAELSKLPDIEKDIRNRVKFDPPATAEISDQQIEKLVAVQAEVRKRLGARVDAMEAKYKTLSEKKDVSLNDAATLLQAYGDLAGTWMEAKRAQVEALNTTGLSLDEYQWVREQAYRSLGMAFVDVDLKKLAASARDGMPSDFAELRGSISDEALAANKARLQKFKKILEDNLALAAFGL